MAEAAPAASAATVLSGNSAAPAAAAPAASPAAASGSPAAAAPAAPATAAANAAWYGDLSSNAELKAFAETKAFKDPGAALESMRNLEKLVGVPADQLIRKPKDANDVEGQKAFRTALGVPEAAEAYEIKSPDGPAGADFVKWAGNTFLDAGIPKEAAGKIVAKWNEFATAQLAAIEQSNQTAFANGLVQLKDSWGAAAPERLELAARAARAFGPALGMKEIGDDVFKSLERGAGDGVTLIKFLAEVGSRLGDDKFVRGNAPAFTMTAEQANAKITELRADKAWTSAYLGGDKNKQAEMQRLQEISVGTAK
jgi:hypothetical protein